MMKPIRIKDFFLLDSGKLVLVPGHSLQRVVRKMIKQSRHARALKKKRPS
jgi:hypothetical protein